jgi:diaminopimelate epimerase
METTDHSGISHSFDNQRPSRISDCMPTLHFTKMNGAGNDFVMLDNRDLQHHLDKAAIARLCDRHRGVGADGLIAVEPARNGANYRMRYYNADGGEAEMCGNGARCFARFASRLGGGSGAISFETPVGTIGATLLGEDVRLSMSTPHSLAIGTALVVADEKLTVHFVNTGVPHAVVFVEDLEKTDVLRLGAALRHHAHFAPKGTNANFAAELPGGGIAIRTYERGVENETLACGTGVTAAALIFSRLTGAPSPVSVRVRGGDVLSVGFEADGEGWRNVTLTGPADFVFEGEAAL